MTEHKHAAVLRAIADGREHKNARLTESDVRAILESPLGHRLLARQYGVGITTIRDIRRGHTWQHVFKELGKVYHNPGRMIAAPLSERIKNNVTITESGCWVWRLRRNKNSYGEITVDQDVQLVHRISYETFVGLIPTDMTIDHLCLNQACCNPSHLEVVTRAENSRRQLARQSRHPNGHFIRTKGTSR